MDINYQKLNSQDLKSLTELIKLYEEVFKMQGFKIPDDDYLKSLLINENIIFYVAFMGNSVIGGLTAHILPSTYFQASEIYIYDLAVMAQYQRKGVGTQLLAALKDYTKKLGMKEIFVQVDIEDEYAIDFYEKTGGIAENVVHFCYNLTLD